jgi:prepilin-type N-terminal cleavage/methylation domain-containing protein
MEKKNGFTLIELLVVMAIVVILFGVLLPALSRAREQARRGVCISNLKQIYLGIRMYAHDYDGIFPDYSGEAIDPGEGETPNGLGDTYVERVYNKLLGLLQSGPPYLRDPGLFLCPSQKRDKKSPYGWIQKPEHCSYSYALPISVTKTFPGEVEVIVVETVPLSVVSQPDSAVLVDKQRPEAINTSNNGVWTSIELTVENNHKTDGVNVLFVEGSAHWIRAYLDADGKYKIPTTGDYKGIPNWNTLYNNY